LSLNNNVPSHSNPYLQQPEHNSHGGGNRVTDRSPAWRALFASDAVRQAFTHLSNQDIKHFAALPLKMTMKTIAASGWITWIQSLLPGIMQIQSLTAPRSFRTTIVGPVHTSTARSQTGLAAWFWIQDLLKIGEETRVWTRMTGERYLHFLPIEKHVL
jgi:hypothetical protein